MSIFVDENTKVIVQGLTGGQGRFHGLRNRDYGTKVVGGRHPGQGRHRRRGHPRLRLGEGGGRRRPGATRVVRRRAAAVRRRGDPRGGRGRDHVHRLHHRGHPGPGRGRHLQPARRGLPRRAPARTELPGHHQSRASATSASPRATSPSPGGPVGIVSRSGTLTYQALHELSSAGRRPDDLRRHRRRPGAGHELHRLPRGLPGRPRDQGRHDDRRDRRLGRRARRRVDQAQHDQAGRRLHRGRDRAPGAQDGPRRGHHLGLEGHGPGEDGGARRRPACTSA